MLTISKNLIKLEQAICLSNLEVLHLGLLFKMNKQTNEEHLGLKHFFFSTVSIIFPSKILQSTTVWSNYAAENKSQAFIPQSSLPPA